jgi:hypothetical protein
MFRIEAHMKKTLCFLLLLFALALSAAEISQDRAISLARSILQVKSGAHHITRHAAISNEDNPLAYVCFLSPTGYMVISADETLPPLMAYSLDAPFGELNSDNPLRNLLIADMKLRLKMSDNRNITAWQEAERNPGHYSLRNDYLLSSNWNQTYPWNMMVPMDPVSNSRSLAGCPAIAMGQIVAYLQALNGTRLNDTDDYYHSYSGRNYTIDDDHETLGFPSFPDLNEYLERVNTSFKYNYALSDSLKAALVFACGTVMHQVYSSQASGTFAVNQAFSGFQRFGFDTAELLGPEAPDLYDRMMANLAEELPVHLAVVTPAWDAGHNVVVDGYAEGMYHLNFGWGGQYNGWYNLPDGIPYNLSVVEGAVVDLYPREYVFCMPQSIALEAGGSQFIEIINLSDTGQDLQDIVFGPGLDADEWQVSLELPAALNPLGMLSFHLTHLLPVRETINSEIRLIFSDTAYSIPLALEGVTSNSDAALIPAAIKVSVNPNPFRDGCVFVCTEKLNDAILKVYNLKGQLLHKSTDLQWQGRDLQGRDCANGIYLYHIEADGVSTVGKVLRVK